MRQAVLASHPEELRHVPNEAEVESVRFLLFLKERVPVEDPKVQ
jgi:hypothetical protein